ncbi:hypothetical protein FLL45_01625 [Aliikangiella marina]|uniref:Uncharacterized protein n=1 Tax=Aliikangiella marina TaxID=1712262 RepID=A0A545THI2_9GAMM|nr:hypothetical protein [Aliikangiella marina]TQV76687.1 hypothetical protein FLL45_01625 [Aliikangiella marina]
MKKVGIWAVLTLTVLSLAIIAELTILNIIATGFGLVMPIFYLGYILVKYHGAQYEFETVTENDKNFELIVNEDFEDRRVEKLPPKELLMELLKLDQEASEINATDQNDFVKAGKILDLKVKRRELRSQFPEFYQNEIEFKKKEVEEKITKQREVFSWRDHERGE